MVNSLQNRWYTAQPRLPKSGAWMSHIHNGIIDIPAEDSPASDAERFWKCDFAIQDDPIRNKRDYGHTHRGAAYYGPSRRDQ